MNLSISSCLLSVSMLRVEFIIYDPDTYNEVNF